MKIPPSLKIGGHYYQVVCDGEMARDHAIAGSHAWQRNTIKIDGSLPHSRQAETLLHEILHALFFNSGMEEIEELRDREEYLVNALSNGLYQVLSDNDLDFQEPENSV